MSNYSDYILQITNLEKELNLMLADYQKKAEGNENTIVFEKKLEQKFDDFKSAHMRIERSLEEEREELPPKEVDSRTKKINNLKLSLQRMRDKFESLKKEKYKYKGNSDFLNQQYIESDEMKRMNNAQFLDYQQKKLKAQDDKIDDIIGLTKETREIGKDVKDDLEKQNVLLGQIDEDMDVLDTRMARTKKKFETYIKKSSNCLLIIILIVEVALILVFGYYWFIK